MTYALEINDLKKTYADGFEALKGIDFTVDVGDFYALLGPNGAGKSTIIGVLCSLVEKTSGTVKIFGKDIDTNFAEAKRHIGVVPQEFNFNQFETVANIVITQGGYYGLPRAVAKARSEKYLKMLDLWGKKNTVARMLSGGMKRRLMIARALVHEPDLLILDEPTAGVDIELRRSMWEFLTKVNKEGTTIILTTHYLEEAESLCRNIGIINSGEMIENTSMKSLLRRLNKEIFVFDVAENIELDLSGQVAIADYEIRQTDAHTFEVEVDKNQHLNGLFKALDVAGIEVQSMRNKASRLEEVFVSLLN